MEGGDEARTPRRIAAGLAAAAIAAAIGVGVAARLDDPLSSPVVPAEDPYTHLVLVREHVRDGDLDPLYDPGSLYPPGLHAVLAAIWAYSGADLYQIVRLGPVLFGALAILGAALLVGRLEGWGAGFVAALAVALAPEAVFRTTMMSPTALDLALLPFLLYALLRTLQGQLAWSVPAACLSGFLLLSHPWLFGVLAPAGIAFVALASLLPWPASRGPPLSLRGLAAGIAIVGTATALSLSGCWGGCGSGFQDVLPLSLAPMAAAAAPVALLASLALAAGLALDARRGDRPAWRVSDEILRKAGVRPAAGLLLAAALLVVVVPAARNGMPEYVNLPRMLGWPVLALAALGWGLLPWIRGPAPFLGAAVAVATLPFVAYNPLDSPYWPHRTAVYLGLGLAILCGSAAGALARWAAGPARRVSGAVGRRGRAAARPLLLVLPAAIVTLTVGGVVYAATPAAYPGGWYRLFQPCEFEALQEVAARADGDSSALVVTGDWQSKLVVAALTTDVSRIWYKADFFTTDRERQGVVSYAASSGRPLYVVVDTHLRRETPSAETSFLQNPPWTPVAQASCGTSGEPPVSAFALLPETP